MILLLALVAGYCAGLGWAKWQKATWEPPVLRFFWLVVVAFLPQAFAFYLPGLREQLARPVVALCLVNSQVGLLLFCLANRQLPGMPVLALGLLCNLLVIGANGGLMPISTLTAAHLLPASRLAGLEPGSRFGLSKDVLLLPETIMFPWLADRFLPPGWFPYQFAFSLGDVFIGAGAFLILVFAPKTPRPGMKGSVSYVDHQPNI
jgi:hypothetical protein